MMIFGHSWGAPTDLLEKVIILVTHSIWLACIPMISPMRTTLSNAGDDWDSGANILQSLNKAQVSLLPKVTKHSKKIRKEKTLWWKSDWSTLGELQLPCRRGALPRPQRLLGLLPGGELVLSFFISYIHHSSLLFISNTIHYYCLSLLFESSVRARGANAQLLPVRPQVRSLNWFLNSQWFSPQFTKEFLKRSFNVFPQFTKEFFKRSFNIAGQSNESTSQTKESHPTHSSPICK